MSDLVVPATPSKALDWLSVVRPEEVVHWDTETTGLYPWAGARCRILSLAVSNQASGGPVASLVVDLWGGSPADVDALWRKLMTFPMACHNAAFDLRWPMLFGHHPERYVYCTKLLAQLLAAGRMADYYIVKRPNLKVVVKRYLGIDLAKDQQKSDWGQHALTQAQLAYARQDAEILVPLLAALRTQVRALGYESAAAIEMRAVPAWSMMETAGVPFSPSVWHQQFCLASAEEQKAEARLNELCVPPGQMFPGFKKWLWSSPKECAQALATGGHIVTSTDDDHLAQLEHDGSEVARTLRQFRSWYTLVHRYDPDWVKKALQQQGSEHRLFPRWDQLGAASSGRTSCDGPNLQNIPEDLRPAICVPEGREFVGVDLSQIELRIAARISGDLEMIRAYQQGQDIHALTGKAVLGKDTLTSHERKVAKSANFGLLYGMGAPRFKGYALSEFGVYLSYAEAQNLRDRFFRAYPGLRAWHRQVGSNDNEVTTTTLLGRKRPEVFSFSEKLNTPVQGTGADLLKMWMAAVYKQRDQAPCPWELHLAVHDELVFSCPEGYGQELGQWARSLAIEVASPILDPVPVDAGVAVGQAWSKGK